jgi:uncharacterized protein
MSALLLQDGLYFLLTPSLVTLCAMGGVGSAVALVPSLPLLGLPLDLAKAIGLLESPLFLWLFANHGWKQPTGFI